MSNPSTIHRFTSFERLVARLRDDFHSGNQDFVLLYAYNGTGKTRLSMAFKNAGKSRNAGNPDTLYFNACTEDLFVQGSDLAGDSTRALRLNADSRFFAGMKNLALDKSIRAYAGRYADIAGLLRRLLEKAATFFSKKHFSAQPAAPAS